MLSATTEIDRNATCHTSYWRPLADGSEHPRHYIMLGAREVAELVATGTYSLPERDIPESVKEWRKLQEAAIDTIAENDINLLGALEERIDTVRNGRG